MQLQEVFKDYNKGILSLVDPSTRINDIASAITAAVQSTALYALRAVGLFDYNVSSTVSGAVIPDESITEEAVQRRLTVHNAEIPDVVGAIGAGNLDGLGYGTIEVGTDELIGAGAGTLSVEGTDYYVITPDVIAKISFNYGDVLVVSDGVNIIVEGDFEKLFSIDMLSKDVGSDGKLLVGSESLAVNFNQKRGGYAYFSAANILYYDFGKAS